MQREISSNSATSRCLYRNEKLAGVAVHGPRSVRGGGGAHCAPSASVGAPGVVRWARQRARRRQELHCGLRRWRHLGRFRARRSGRTRAFRLRLRHWPESTDQLQLVPTFRSPGLPNLAGPGALVGPGASDPRPVSHGRQRAAVARRHGPRLVGADRARVLRSQSRRQSETLGPELRVGLASFRRSRRRRRDRWRCVGWGLVTLGRTSRKPLLNKRSAFARGDRS